MTVTCIGDVPHFAVAEFAKEKSNNTSVIVDFCLKPDDGSIAILKAVRERALKTLTNIALYKPHIRYVQVFCYGAAHDSEMVHRFAEEYGISTCVIDLEVVLEYSPPLVRNLLWDACDGLPLRIPDSKTALAFITLTTAFDFVKKHMFDHGLVQISGVPKMTFEELATRICTKPNVHLVFSE